MFHYLNFMEFIIFSIISAKEKAPMESYEAAQAIFPTVSRPLQKYLRVTRQQPRHSVDSILQHLSTCLSYDLSPRAFLEKYLVTTPVLQVCKKKFVKLKYSDTTISRKKHQITFTTFMKVIFYSKLNIYVFF